MMQLMLWQSWLLCTLCLLWQVSVEEMNKNMMQVCACLLVLLHISSVKNGTYMLRKAHNYMLHSVSQKFPENLLWNSSHVGVTNNHNGPFVPVKEGRFCFSFFLSLALCSSALQWIQDNFINWLIVLCNNFFHFLCSFEVAYAKEWPTLKFCCENNSQP